jgi:hypothetical protein
MSEPPPVRPDYAPPPSGVQLPNTLALSSMICGILSLVMLCAGCAFVFISFISPVLAIAAIVLAVMARREIAAGRQRGQGMAVAGLVCGVVALLLFIIGVVIMGLILGAGMWADTHLREMDPQRQDPVPGEPLPGEPVQQWQLQIEALRMLWYWITR